MRLIRGIYRFIDKRIILPITRLIVSILNKFKKANQPLESVLKSKSSIIIISLIISVLLFVLVDKRGNLSLEKSAEVLYNQKVIVDYNNEEYVIEGLPETVDITMVGSRANLYLAKQLSNQNVSVDLSKLGVGTHQVTLKYKQAISNVEYKLDPSIVSVTISNKQSSTKEITQEVLNLDLLDTKYAIKNISLFNTIESSKDKDKEEVEEKEEISSVIVKGKDEIIKKVAIVKALINIENISKNQVNTGENTIKNVPLAAYDENGQKLDVEMVPSMVNAVVDLESNSKEVPINVVVKNVENIVFGKAISEIDTSIKKVTIYGSSDVLNEINKIDVEISIPKDLKSDKKFTKTIKKPNGVRALSSKTVNIDVKIGDQSKTEVSGVKISYKNLGSGLVVQGVEDTPTEIPIIITGVSSVIKDITAQEVYAYVDLNGLGEGEQTVKVYAEGSDNRVTYEPKVKEIKLLISKK